MHRDGQDQANTKEIQQLESSSVTDEGKGDTSDRHQADGHPDILKDMEEEDGRYTDAGTSPIKVFGPVGND